MCVLKLHCNVIHSVLEVTKIHWGTLVGDRFYIFKLIDVGNHTIFNLCTKREKLLSCM